MDPDGKIQYTCNVTCQILNYWEEFHRFPTVHFYPFVYCASLFPFNGNKTNLVHVQIGNLVLICITLSYYMHCTNLHSYDTMIQL
jgi:hypothetical protein